MGAVAEIQAKYVGASVEQRLDHFLGRGNWAERGDDLGLAVAVNGRAFGWHHTTLETQELAGRVFRNHAAAIGIAHLEVAFAIGSTSGFGVVAGVGALEIAGMQVDGIVIGELLAGIAFVILQGAGLDFADTFTVHQITGLAAIIIGLAALQAA